MTTQSATDAVVALIQDYAHQGRFEGTSLDKFEGLLRAVPAESLNQYNAVSSHCLDCHDGENCHRACSVLDLSRY
jgi:hypothetical protein